MAKSVADRESQCPMVRRLRFPGIPLALLATALSFGCASAAAQAPTSSVALGGDGFPADPRLKDDQVNHWFNYGIFQVSGDHALVRTGNIVQELIDGPETFREMANVIRTASQPNETALPAVVAEYQFGKNPGEPALFTDPGLLAEGPDKCIYSTSPQGGKANRGIAFKITPDLRTLTILHEFDFMTGVTPMGGLSRIGDNFYGTTYEGGKYGAGLIFRMTPDGGVSDLWDFRNGKIVNPPPPPNQPSEQDKLDAAGSYPAAAPVNGARGGMFGVTTYSNNQQGGVLYSGTLKGLYQFKGECGYLPTSLIAGSDGNLYGTCVKGNALCRFGTVFKATPAGGVSVVHVFNNDDGAQPIAVMQGKDGVLYGVTAGGGYASNFPGVVFSLTTGRDFKVLHRFTGGTDGGWPTSGLVEKDGYLYGATRGGGLGPLGRGLLYRIKPSGDDFAVIHYFDMYANGKNPATSLFVHSNGKIYGTTFEGGAKNQGVMYCVDVPRYIYLLGWWLTDDFPILIGDPNSTVDQLFGHESAEGAQVRAMLWDSNKKTATQEKYWPVGQQNQQAVDDINDMTNGAAIHDNNTLDFGAHHHKILVVAGSQGLIAFCGGLDLNPDRIYEQGQGPNSNGDTKGAPLHDVHCRIQGPAAGDLVDTFMERWNDHSDHVDLDKQKGELRAKYAMKPPPIKDGTCYVQVGRTFPNGARYTGIHGTYPLNTGYAFAPRGETSAARIILHGIGQARKFIYIEDQYFVDTAPNKVGLDVRAALITSLQRIQGLIVVLPHGSITDMGPPYFDNQVNYRRKKLIDALKQAPGGEKVHIYFRKDPPRPHTYVHAKTWIFDDEFAIIGSANCNRRSWTHDSETIVGICDQGDGSKCRMPHRMRMRLWQEQLGLGNTPENHALLNDGAAALPLWINLPPSARVMHYDKITPEVNPSDESWDRVIDPDGS
jgi:uncharacterized repeat protein (TIGR03803 family)